MKIGELAKRLGTTVSALRFYEQQGLVHPGRTAGGTRDYSEADVSRFAALLALAALDVPLERIHEISRLRPQSRTGDAAGRKVDASLAALQLELENRRDQINHLLKDIRKTRRRLEGCHHCGKRPVRSNCDGCDVASDLLECEITHIVWDEETRP